MMKNNWVRKQLKGLKNALNMGYERDSVDDVCYEVEFIDNAIAAQDLKLKASTRRMRTRNAIARRKNFFKSIWAHDIFERWPVYDHKIRSCSSPCDWKRDRHEIEAFHNRKAEKILKREMHHILNNIDDVA